MISSGVSVGSPQIVIKLQRPATPFSSFGQAVSAQVASAACVLHDP
jgi:hypothetical protein